jgi:hypothetical protein
MVRLVECQSKGSDLSRGTGNGANSLGFERDPSHRRAERTARQWLQGAAEFGPLFKKTIKGLALRGRGKSFRQIAVEAGVSAMTVQRIVAAHG